jgi:serine O-acetyltransferase
MIIQTLLADLQRQYYFAGDRTRRPTIWGLLTHIPSPRFLPVFLCRLAHSLDKHHLTIPARAVSMSNFVLFGIEIAMRCEIGPGLYFPHTVGTVIGARRIGNNVTIYHGATIGAKRMDLGYDPEQRPLIGNNVVIGSGAKVLGGIVIGDGATVGANSVVTRSVPENALVGGIPARIIRNGKP